MNRLLVVLVVALFVAIASANEFARIRQPAPKFQAQAIVDGKIKTISLDDYKGKYVYLFFYPLDFTFVCPTEISSISERIEEFRKIGCEVLGVSVDSVYTHLAWTNTPRKQGGLGSVSFPLVSDLTHQISKDYGTYMPEDGHSIRGSFIIGTDGVIKQITLNDAQVGRSVDEALRLIKAFQYTDKHVGEVCPVNWKEGDASMIADPVRSLDYFKAVNYDQKQVVVQVEISIYYKFGKTALYRVDVRLRLLFLFAIRIYHIPLMLFPHYLTLMDGPTVYNLFNPPPPFFIAIFLITVVPATLPYGDN
ncbi:hypothetical protein DFA_01595 [Cavenderia fasciculata]|uniref:thioredoxin-dependent peroxiredoxin n=1 Tax=Cavenderia fasciculata TaxID=261658 RepID=F4PTN9_CACFS|nr:uncharacterized protein DFA_01595 [Cavenderia fasciculata]EGG21709.1 hypothetical protein DFA_01595 [Cavenderia fasciculata]|eukprot:XP_004359559.1 hypothetical protein DFA_01595 [Cavenderia fasciculata]